MSNKPMIIKPYVSKGEWQSRSLKEMLPDYKDLFLNPNGAWKEGKYVFLLRGKAAAILSLEACPNDKNALELIVALSMFSVIDEYSYCHGVVRLNPQDNCIGISWSELMEVYKDAPNARETIAFYPFLAPHEYRWTPIIYPKKEEGENKDV
jgi:hypothetical protein